MLGSERRQKPLRIGIPSYLSYPVVSPFCGNFREIHPGLFPHLVEMPAEEMSQYWNDGDLDAGFLSLATPSRLSDEIHSTIVWEAPRLVCLSKRHPLAAKEVLHAYDIAQLEIVLIPREHHRSHYDYQLEALRAVGIEPRLVATDVTNTQSQMGLGGVGTQVTAAWRPLRPILASAPVLESGHHVGETLWAALSRHSRQ